MTTYRTRRLPARTIRQQQAGAQSCPRSILQCHWLSIPPGDESPAIDSCNVVNASVGIYSLDQRWDLTHWADNLGDEYYWLTVTQGANTVIRFPGMTRT
jgi:hypothetical protein